MKNSNKTFQLGISSWTYPWSAGAATGPQPQNKMTPIQLLKKAVELKVQVVQIADNIPIEQLNTNELNELKSFATKNNIQIEVGTKGVNFDHLIKMIEICEFLDARILRTLPALFGKKIGMSEVEKNIKKILPFLDEKKITLVLENTEAFLAHEYKALMEKINHPDFRMCLDTANAIGRFEGPHYVIDTLIKYCANFHFKDIYPIRSSTLMGFQINGAVSGKGQIPLQYALDKLRAENLFTSVILEQWPPLLEDIEETVKNENQMAKESISYLKSVLRYA